MSRLLLCLISPMNSLERIYLHDDVWMIGGHPIGEGFIPV